MIFTGVDGLNGSEKQQVWDERREAQLRASGEHGYTNWRHWWFSWRWEDEAEAGYRWLGGTTIIERKMAIYHDRYWNFGHMFADFIMPYTMHYINQHPPSNTTLTRLTHTIDRILIHTRLPNPTLTLPTRLAPPQPLRPAHPRPAHQRLHPSHLP